MDIRNINNIEVTVAGTISDDELSIYLTQLQAKNKHKIIKADINIDGDFVEVGYVFEVVPFERIRRITGYLVGSMSKWGNGKRAEEKDRVKHC